MEVTIEKMEGEQKDGESTSSKELQQRVNQEQLNFIR